MTEITIFRKKLYDIKMNGVDWLTRYIYRVNRVKAVKLWYKHHTKKDLNLDSPHTFDEKIQWLKLYWQHPLMIECADKYDVRQYVNSKNVPEILNTVFGVYSDTSEIEWDLFPDKFVIKTTNSTDTNIICLDKQDFDKVEAEKKLDKWMKEKSNKVVTERHYAHMTPKIMSEKFIESPDSPFPTDYKFFCFNGKPLFVSVVEGRTEEALKTNIYRTYYDMSWKRVMLDKQEVELDVLPEKPESFEKMIGYAKILSKDFPFVRVDFYKGESTPILGEMTFTPSGGAANYYKNDVQLLLGKELQLPEKKIINNW